MNKFVTVLALCGVAACGTTPSGSSAPTVQLSAKERFIRAIEGQNCVLNKDNVAAILADASMTADDMRRIVPELQAAGSAEVADDDEIRILSDNCI